MHGTKNTKHSDISEEDTSVRQKNIIRYVWEDTPIKYERRYSDKSEEDTTIC